jgi:hypothetical protein
MTPSYFNFDQVLPTLEKINLKPEAVVFGEAIAPSSPGSASTSVAASTWTLPQMLEHCAQSIEYSMFGFPKHKNRVFKKTIGKFVKNRFLKKGAMSHNLHAAIPGASTLSSQLSIQDSCSRLLTAIKTFRGFTAPLSEHFAYGPLAKEEYEAMHAMHIANHLKNVDFKST